MWLRVIRGVAQAKKKLARKGPLDLSHLPPDMVERTEKLFGQPLTAQESVQRILDDVRRQGDRAVRHYTRLLDKVELKRLEVSRQELAGARRKVDEGLLQALRVAAQRIESYHRATLPKSWVDLERGLGEMVLPLERVGIYVPGGTASYPSTVLMTAIPARVAGVSEIILASPSTSPPVLAAAEMAGVDRVFRIGGVQAIAAMAFGTRRVPKVDKICGPGNIFVTLAKKLVFGEVDIDGLYGPTETVLVADETANPAHCAADLLAQAEHDAMASPILVTTSLALVGEVEGELDRQLATLERRDIAEASLASGGWVVLVDCVEEALEVANFVAPEHMCLLIKDPWAWAGQVRNAGGLFLGDFSPEVVGDYIAGPSHVMPTGGTARFKGALGVHQFLKTMPVIGLNAHGYAELAQAGARIARAEGLTGHARALEIRLNGVQEDKERP